MSVRGWCLARPGCAQEAQSGSPVLCRHHLRSAWPGSQSVAQSQVVAGGPVRGWGDGGRTWPAFPLPLREAIFGAKSVGPLSYWEHPERAPHCSLAAEPVSLVKQSPQLGGEERETGSSWENWTP